MVAERILTKFIETPPSYRRPRFGYSRESVPDLVRGGCYSNRGRDPFDGMKGLFGAPREEKTHPQTRQWTAPRSTSAFQHPVLSEDDIQRERARLAHEWSEVLQQEAALAAIKSPQAAQREWLSSNSSQLANQPAISNGQRPVPSPGGALTTSGVMNGSPARPAQDHAAAGLVLSQAMLVDLVRDEM